MFKKQKKGTAIGTKFSLPYAIIFMAALEEEILESLIKKPWLCRRYLDYIFVIWHHGENELKQFIGKLNKFHSTIKFTCDYSQERLHFLDVQVILNVNRFACKRNG